MGILYSSPDRRATGETCRGKLKLEYNILL